MTRFEIDSDGFKKQMRELKPFRIVQEIIANSFDEDSVTTINCEIQTSGQHQITVKIEDDGNGFINIEESYTLYARSKKRNDPSKRGRFNLGEKQFLALAKFGYIESGMNRIEFYQDSRKQIPIPPRKGTLVYGEMEWDGTEIVDILQTLQKLIVPQDKTLNINNIKVTKREPVRTIKKAILPTMMIGQNDVMMRIERPVNIVLYKLNQNEKAWLYELGIPVQRLEMGELWHVDIQSKIPLSPTRSNVTQSYLKKLHAHIVNNTYDLINPDDSTNKFVTNGLSGATKTAFEAVTVKRYGSKNLIVESSTDYRANEKAEEHGDIFLRTGDMDRETRKHGEELGVISYAGEKYATTFGIGSGELVLEDSKTQFVRSVVRKIALDIIKKNIDVNFTNDKDSIETASYGSHGMTFNTGHIKLEELASFSARTIGVIIHELAHDSESVDEGHAHLSMEYIHELQRIAGLIGEKGIKHWTDVGDKN